MQRVFALAGRRGRVLAGVLVTAAIVAVPAALALNPDTKVSFGSPTDCQRSRQRANEARDSSAIRAARSRPAGASICRYC